MKRSKRERLAYSRFLGAWLFTALSIVVIFVFVMWSIHFIRSIDYASTAKDLPSTVIFLLEFGLAIIAVAVSVWIGLNIYNVIAKDDLVTLESQIEDLKTVEVRLKTTQRNQNAAVRSLLLSSLMKTQTDEMSVLFIDRISELRLEDLDSALLSEMLLIEESFASIVDGYNKRNRPVIEKFYAAGKNYCQQFREALDRNSESLEEMGTLYFYKSYLFFRRADFNFYYSIRPSNPPARSQADAMRKYCELLSESIEGYNRVSCLLSESLPGGMPQRIKSYMDNSIGYSYYQKYGYLKAPNDIEAAKEYCRMACYPDGEEAFAQPGYDRSFARSVYYRNYAHCLNSMMTGIAGVQAALPHFRRSLELDYRDSKAHFNLASFTLKAIVESEGLGGNRVRLLNRIYISPSYQGDIDSAIKNLRWAITFNKEFTDPYFLIAHAYTLKMLMVHNPVERDSFFEQAVDVLDTYKRLCPPDNTDTYLFYERNLYEAHGDVWKAAEINSKLNGGDSQAIADLYVKSMMGQDVDEL